MRILIVDDLASNRMLLSEMVTGFGYQCLTVDDGDSAITAMEMFEPDVVLLDVLMPGRSGLDTAPKLKELAGDVHLPIIFITALDDQETLLNCLAAGGDDFISKPFASVVLEAKLRAHGRNRELSKSLAEKNSVLAYHSSRVEREHQIVEHIFQNSLARNYLDYPHLHTYLSPMSMFNGDVLLAAPGPLGNMYFFLGDFTGHGLSAAVGALPISQTFFSMADQGASVGEIVREMNSRLHELLPSDMFLAGLLIELSASGERITYWNGGIPPAQLIHGDGQVQQVLGPQNLALGILDNHEFDSRVSSLRVAHDDSLVFYTDGLSELPDDEGLLGSNGLQKILAKVCNMAELSAEVRERMRTTEQRDDVSMAWLRCRPTGLKKRDVAQALSPLAFQVKFELNAEAIKSQDPVNRIVRDLANIDGLAQFKSQFFTVLQELYNNAVEHGLLKLDSELKSTHEGFEQYYQLYYERLRSLTEGRVDIELQYQPQAARMMIRISDSGDGFCHKSSQARHQGREEMVFGRGLTLVEELTEQLNWHDNGRTVECWLPLNKPLPQRS